MSNRKTVWEMTVPLQRETKIWRYMDMGQFVSMLETKSLWFSSAARFDDPFEGSHSKMYVDLMESLLQGKAELRQNIEFARALPKYTYVNCWHMSDSETYGMWKIYGKTNHAIAIQTSYEKLYQSLKHRGDIVLGVVDYKCYEKDQLNPTGPTELIPYFNKSKFFEDERELRAVIQNAEALRSTLFTSSSLCTEIELVNGIEVEVDLSNMIEQVYLSPASPSNYKRAVTSLLLKYGHEALSRNVQQSALGREPLYGPSI